MASYMVAANGGTGRPSFANLVAAIPQLILEMVLPPRPPKMVDGEVYFQFSREEITKLAEPFVLFNDPQIFEATSIIGCSLYIYSQWLGSFDHSGCLFYAKAKEHVCTYS